MEECNECHQIRPGGVCPDGCELTVCGFCRADGHALRCARLAREKERQRAAFVDSPPSAPGTRIPGGFMYAWTSAPLKKEKDLEEHVNVGCDGCGMKPLRGVRYKCCNCPNADLCEACEASIKHDPTHVFIKIRRPVPTGFNGSEVMTKKPLLPGTLYEQCEEPFRFA